MAGWDVTVQFVSVDGANLLDRMVVNAGDVHRAANEAIEVAKDRHRSAGDFRVIAAVENFEYSAGRTLTGKLHV